ncbi:MAG: hypothetical protein DBX44_01395 [Oscillospiraceae bacterium]|nr:MAG: hypothetical protein DBX44_01395 [Oscillospiraceae bacterium]
MLLSKSVFTTLLAAALLLTSCEAASVPSSPASSAALDTDSGSASSNEADPSEETSFTGVLVEAAMHTIIIRTDDGALHEFSLSDQTDRSGVDGMLLGDRLKVVCRDQPGEAPLVLSIESLPASSTAGQE